MIYIYIDLFMNSIHIIYIYICRYIYIYFDSNDIYIYVCMYVFMYVYIYVYPKGWWALINQFWFYDLQYYMVHHICVFTSNWLYWSWWIGGAENPEIRRSRGAATGICLLLVVTKYIQGNYSDCSHKAQEFSVWM